MGFQPIYYITLCCPTVERSLDMAGRYVERGVTALQVDMPSKQPVYETDFVRALMGRALENYKGYDVYRDAFARLRAAYPQLDLHIVVYPDVIESIGREQFTDFFFRCRLASVMVAGGDPDTTAYLRAQGIRVIGRIDRMLDDAQLKLLKDAPADAIYNFNYKKHPEVQPHGCTTFGEKLSYIRAAGVRAKIYAVEGIGNAEMMREVRDAGADGALVGNVLMRLWDQPHKLWQLLNQFQQTAVL